MAPMDTHDRRDDRQPPPGLPLRESLRPAIAALPGSGILEIFNHGLGRPDLIALWAGEGDLPTPDYVSMAAIKALCEGQTRYTYQFGIPALREALARDLTAIHGRPVPVDTIAVTVGGMQAISLTMQALVGEGDEVVLPSPLWPNAAMAVRVCGGHDVAVPLDFDPDRGWRLDLDRFADAIGPRTKALFLNAPGNPTGWTMSREDILAIRDLARERDLWIIADEAYARITFEGPPAPSFLDVMGPEEKVISVNTFSKNWAMTGWRIGWAVVPPPVARTIADLNQYNSSGVATFLQYGALAAVEQGGEMVERMRALCRRGRDVVDDALAGLDRVRYSSPQAGFYTFFSVDGESDARSLAFRLLDETGVGLAPGTAFGPGGEKFLRLCFATSEDTLTRALDRLIPALR